MGLLVVELEERGVVVVGSDILGSDGSGSDILGSDALSSNVLDADAVDDKFIPLKASVRSDTLGRHASTSKRRSTLSPAKFWMRQIVEVGLGLWCDSVDVHM